MNEPALSLLRHLREGNGIPAGSRLLVAVSGGADSLALLHLYIHAQEALNLTLRAATFDHGLRGDQSRDDAAFAVETAAKWGVPCVTGSAALDPAAPAVEARAREARYAFLAAAARDFGAAYVATAHHADDQAETVLLNMIRGTGARGLGGMRPAAPLPNAPDLILVRPLLGVRRADLEAYCRQEGIVWRDDPTNADTRYRRNWARHVVLPLLREANPNVTVAFANAASVLAEEDALLDSQAAASLVGAASITPDRIWITRDAFASWPAPIQRRALVQAAGRVSATFEPDFGHLQSALTLCRRPEGGEANFSGEIKVIVDSGYVTVARRGASWSPPHAGFWCSENASAPPVVAAAEADIRVRVPENAAVYARARRDGDRVFPVGLGGQSQKLKDWFINRKVPRQLRDYLMLIEADGQIAALWDGQTWNFFAPPFQAETVEVGLSLR